MSNRRVTVLLPLLCACLAQPPPAGESAVDAGTPDAAAEDPPEADQLLDNENFERGADGWQIGGDAMIGDGDTLGVSFTAASGDVFAQVGRKNSSQNSISQLVTVPDWAAGLRLTGQHCFDTEDEDETRDDVLTILLLDGEGGELETLLDMSNAEIGAICDWTGFTLIPAASHAGEQIQISMTASSDSEGLTAFWFDDLHLTASPE